MASSTNQASGNDGIDAIRPDLEAFASLWSALRANYEGTNITKTIARLLHMYQPEDGIQAYERLLKTLFVLLEDFDGNGLRLLVSMVPLPKGSSAETIKEVFFRSTGFIRIDAPIVYQNYPLISSVTNPLESETMKDNINEITSQSAEQKITGKPKNFHPSEHLNRHSESPQMMSQEYYPFRGFLQTTNNRSSDVNNYLNCEQAPGQYFVDSPGESASGFKLNWLPTPVLYQNSNSVQSDTSYRDLLVKTVDNQYLRLPIIAFKPPNMHYKRSHQGVSSSQKIQSNGQNHTMISDTMKNAAETQVSGALNNINPEDINKTEDLNNKEIRADLSEHSYGLLKHPEVKQGCNKSENHLVNCDVKKPMTIEDYTLNNLNPGENLTACIKRFLNRTKMVTSPSNMTKLKLNIPESSNIVNDQKKSLLQTPKVPEINSPTKFRENRNLHDGSNALYNYSYQPNSMSELVAYKRQYYEALLSIQRAKMAVANSLALSPMQNCTDYDSYHPDYWVYQQPQRLIMGPSYAQRFAQPEYSGVHNTCVRPNDWMSSYPATSQVAQENPMMHSSVMYNSSRFFYSSPELMTQAPSYAPSETKVEAKKRKLENIVVKLKEG